MNRRDFLRALGFTAAAAVTAPLVSAFVPMSAAPVVPMFESAPLAGNVFVTSAWVNREALRILRGNMAFASRINRFYDDAFEEGPTIDIRLPERYRA